MIDNNDIKEMQDRIDFLRNRAKEEKSTVDWYEGYFMGKEVGLQQALEIIEDVIQ